MFVKRRIPIITYLTIDSEMDGLWEYMGIVVVLGGKSLFSDFHLIFYLWTIVLAVLHNDFMHCFVGHLHLIRP